MSFDILQDRWDDINISIVPPSAGAAIPTTIAFNGDARLKCLAFSGTNATPDEILSSLEILHGYKEETDIHVHIHWYPTNTTVADVKWQLRYAWFNPGTVPPPATTVSVVDTTSGISWNEQTSMVVIPGTGMNMGSRFVFSIFRDAADAQDTYAFNAAVTDFGVHYQKDTIGSLGITTK